MIFVGGLIDANGAFSIKKEVLQLFRVLLCSCLALIVGIQLSGPVSSGHCLVRGFMGGCKLLEVQS